MILDHCPPGDADPGLVREAMDRSTRWAEEAARIRDAVLDPGQLCFGIVQGGTQLALRREHLARLREFGFHGLALGGLSVGEATAQTHATMAAIAPLMPEDRPRYVMGIGTPADLLAAVRAGVDLFDCVIPTRHARNGQMFTWEGRVDIRRARYRDDGGPVDASCACPTCARFSRAYLRHLHEHNDPLYVRLATLHNLRFFHEFVAALRQGLREGRFEATQAALDAVISRHYGREGGAEPA
jgi:queuine tRNA-ribosyltransferase